MPSEGQVVLTLAPVGNVDDIGSYAESEERSTTVPFQLALQEDGEWRITEAPDGLILDTSQFSTVFRRASLMYFDPTAQFLVPDVRWFPAINAATYVSDALVDGPPAPWLAASVVTAFPESVSLRPSVPVEDGVAEVVLGSSAVELSADTLSRMQAQLTATLRTVGVSSVAMSAGATPLDVEPASTRSTRVNTLPLVLTAEGFGFLSGEQLEPIEGLSQALQTVDPVAIQVSPDRDFAGVRLATRAGHAGRGGRRRPRDRHPGGPHRPDGRPVRLYLERPARCPRLVDGVRAGERADLHRRRMARGDPGDRHVALARRHPPCRCAGDRRTDGGVGVGCRPRHRRGAFGTRRACACSRRPSGEQRRPRVAR